MVFSCAFIYVVGSDVKGESFRIRTEEKYRIRNNLESYCLLFLTFSRDSNNTDVGNDKMTNNNIVKNKNNNIEAAKDLVPGDVVLEASPVVSGTVVLNQFEARSLLHFQMLGELGLKGQFLDILVKKIPMTCNMEGKKTSITCNNIMCVNYSSKCIHFHGILLYTYYTSQNLLNF